MKELFEKETAWGPADPPSVNKGLTKIKKIQKKKEKSLVLKTQQRFKSEGQLFDSVEIYVYGMSKDIICKDGKDKLINIIKGYKN